MDMENIINDSKLEHTDYQFKNGCLTNESNLFEVDLFHISPSNFMLDRLHDEELIMKFYYPIKFHPSISDRPLFVYVFINKDATITIRLITAMDENFDYDVYYNRNFSVDEIHAVGVDPIYKLLTRFSYEAFYMVKKGKEQ